jgi:hypothetical protein
MVLEGTRALGGLHERKGDAEPLNDDLRDKHQRALNSGV